VRHDTRFGLRTATRRVVALERQKDDEPRQQREAGGEDAEHPGCAVTVREVASRRRAASHKQHRCDRDDGHGSDDH
jgi:hypothetical protein